jgi:predicted exporter
MISSKGLFYGWSVLVAALLAVAAGCLLQGIPVDTNIMNLLPGTERDPLVVAAIENHNRNFSRRVVFLVSAATEADSQQAALKTGGLARESGLFAEVTDRMNESQGVGLYRFYLPYRASLLSAQDRKLVAQHEYGRLESTVLNAIAAPVPGFSASMLEQDPLLLYTRFLAGFAPQAGRLKLRNGMLTATHDELYHTLVSTVIAGDAFAPDYQQKFLGFYDNLATVLGNQYPGATLTSVGMIHNMAAGTARAKWEISAISAVSMVGLVLLFIFGFRSLKPLIYALIPMNVGLAAAFVACIAVFDSIHIMTLVFGTSLIGVCMDYALHFFSELAYHRPTPTPRQCLDRILPGMTLGMITSVVGFTAFYTTGSTGLRQMALFSSTGLLAAYCCVVFWFPRLPALKATPADNSSALLSRKILAFWDHPNKARTAAVLAAITLITALGIALASVDDDIRSLDNSPPRLLADRARFQDITGINPGSQFFVVGGASPQEVLQREETLTDSLDAAIERGDLREFRATSNYIPSAARQRANYQTVRESIDAMAAALTRIGYQPELIAHYRELYATPEPATLDFEHWREAGVVPNLQWVEPGPGQYASLVYLGGVENVEPVLAATRNMEGVHYVDQVEGISDALMKYRQLTNKMILTAYALIFFILIWRYGFRRAASVLLPPLLAAAAAFALCGFTGQPLTLFNSLAILLVLGLGIDYTIFMAETGGDRTVTMIGILYSTLTTVLGFGLLVFSGTPALKSIGITVFCAITMTWLLAPVAKQDK